MMRFCVGVAVAAGAAAALLQCVHGAKGWFQGRIPSQQATELKQSNVPLPDFITSARRELMLSAFFLTLVAIFARLINKD